MEEKRKLFDEMLRKPGRKHVETIQDLRLHPKLRSADTKNSRPLSFRPSSV